VCVCARARVCASLSSLCVCARVCVCSYRTRSLTRDKIKNKNFYLKNKIFYKKNVQHAIVEVSKARQGQNGRTHEHLLQNGLHLACIGLKKRGGLGFRFGV
jgi:hypothetical protein